MAKKAPVEKPETDWAVTLTSKKTRLVERLLMIAESEDETAALSAIKLLLDLDPESKAETGKPAAALFELPSDTHIDIGKKGPH